jgi:hypothetical protein
VELLIQLRLIYLKAFLLIKARGVIVVFQQKLVVYLLICYRRKPLGLATTSISIAAPLPWNRLGDNVADSGASGQFLILIILTFLM